MRPTTVRLRRTTARLATAIYHESVPLSDLRLLPMGTGVAPGEQPIPADDAAGWQSADVGTRWGGKDETVWFHATAQVPTHWRTRLSEQWPLALRLMLGVGVDGDGFGWPEGLLYINGELAQGINRLHPDVLFSLDTARRGTIALDARMWSGMLPMTHTIERTEIALLDRDCEILWHLLTAGTDLLDVLPADNPLLAPLHDALENATDALHLATVGSDAFSAAATKALQHLQRKLTLLRKRYTAQKHPILTAVGHGHLDIAWQWQTRHGREKAARTFSVATAMMDRYPDYIFMHTSPQLFAWLKDDYPTLYERVRARVADGRFEFAGAMWVEPDINLISGESVVRQLFHGQRLLRQDFERSYDALWLPDAFGFSAALPQLLLRAGITTFLTTKLSWNDTNKMPADTFRWRGIDGSDVLAQFMTVPLRSADPFFNRFDCYGGPVDVQNVLGTWERYRQKSLTNETIFTYGHGDGGAGPMRQHIDALHALQALPGLPELQMGRADEYFHRLRARVWDNPQLPVWEGELYLEYHRGVATTQAWLKHAHRQNEARLLRAESLDAWRWSLARAAAPDMREQLDAAWQSLLVQQFHDILPGSSIHEVYDDARVAMEDLATMLDAISADAVRDIAVLLALPVGCASIVNSSPFPSEPLAELPEALLAHPLVALTDDGAQSLITQRVTWGTGPTITLAALPPMPPGCALVVSAATTPTLPSIATEFMAPRHIPGGLENAFFRVTLDMRGAITSCVDKRVPGGREIVPIGEAINLLMAFDDHPERFDAWEIAPDYERDPHPFTATTIVPGAAGPLCAALDVRHRIGASTIEQSIVLYRDVARIDFVTRFDWHDHHILVKAAFPLDLRTQVVTAETQFGAVERATHRNTSWEAARSESVMHRWVDLSEGGYGVSILNDGCYGYDAHEATVRISLLRSPTFPDPTADQGAHAITYSLFPHLGDWRLGGTVAAAYSLNHPLFCVAETFLPSNQIMDNEMVMEIVPGHFACWTEGCVIAAIKRHSDEDGMIVRIYEAHGTRQTAWIAATQPLASVTECDLLEQPLRSGASAAYPAWSASAVASHDAPIIGDHGWSCMLRPFEVRTFHVKLRALDA